MNLLLNSDPNLDINGEPAKPPLLRTKSHEDILKHIDEQDPLNISSENLFTPIQNLEESPSKPTVEVGEFKEDSKQSTEKKISI